MSVSNVIFVSDLNSYEKLTQGLPNSITHGSSTKRDSRLRDLGIGELGARWHSVFRKRAPSRVPRPSPLRAIFWGYPRCGSLKRILVALRERGIVAKVAALKVGKSVSSISVRSPPRNSSISSTTEHVAQSTIVADCWDGKITL